MDPVTVNIISTVVIFIIFIGIVLWAYSNKTKARFDEAANLIFDDERPNCDVKQKKESTHDD